MYIRSRHRGALRGALFCRETCRIGAQPLDFEPSKFGRGLKSGIVFVAIVFAMQLFNDMGNSHIVGGAELSTGGVLDDSKSESFYKHRRPTEQLLKAGRQSREFPWRENATESSNYNC